MDQLCPDTFRHACAWLDCADLRALCMSSIGCMHGVLESGRLERVEVEVELGEGRERLIVPSERARMLEEQLSTEKLELEKMGLRQLYTFETPAATYTTRGPRVRALYYVFSHPETSWCRFGVGAQAFLNHTIEFVHAKILLAEGLVGATTTEVDDRTTGLIRIEDGNCRFEVEVEIRRTARGKFHPPPLVCEFFV